MDRKKKLRLIQVSLLLVGFLIVFFTLSSEKQVSNKNIISKEIREKIVNQSTDGDIFFNIEYAGLDLSGNRYILKSKEAYIKKSRPEIIDMKDVTAFFYFKDDTTLKVTSDKGIYNNKTLDMFFEENVEGYYEGSDLFAEKAEYSNSKSFLTISKNVKIIDIKGTLVADELIFDIKKQTLDIASFKDSKINANVNIK